jgi:hypothetical protein
MNIGLESAIGAIVFVGIFWWMYSLSTKSSAQRKQEAGTRKIARQPWGDDKVGGRGNR